MSKVFGSNKSETVFGTDAGDVIYAYNGDDVILCNDNDFFWSGKDIVFAGGGNDQILDVQIDPDSFKNSPSFRSKFIGGDGYDTLYVDVYSEGFGFKFDCSDTDKTFTTKSIEEIFYYAANGFDKQHILGTNGDESFYFGRHGWSSNVDGAAGDDCIVGGDSADRFNGGSGRDFLAGRGGADKLTGGDGRDVFFFHPFLDEGGRIIDFVKGEDKIAIGSALEFGGLGSYVEFKRINHSDIQFDAQKFQDLIEFEHSTRAIFVDGVLVAHINGSFNIDENDFLFQ